MRKGSRSERKAQLRGEALKERIISAIHEHADGLGSDVRHDRISFKAIAAQVPCSRTTLLKYQDLVVETLSTRKLAAARRTGEASVQELVRMVASLRDENVALRSELLALQSHHVDLYARFLLASAPVATLFREDALKVSRRMNRCVLCGGRPVGEGPDVVVGFPKQPSRRDAR